MADSSAPTKDVCPMCGGDGFTKIAPPHGWYKRVRASYNIVNAEDTKESYNTSLNEVERLAGLGYELHSFAEDTIGTTWMMQWPIRWKCTSA